MKLLKHLNWSWIGAIASDNAYGRPGIGQIQKEAAKNGICVQFVRFISDVRKYLRSIKYLNFKTN